MHNLIYRFSWQPNFLVSLKSLIQKKHKKTKLHLGWFTRLVQQDTSLNTIKPCAHLSQAPTPWFCPLHQIESLCLPIKLLWPVLLSAQSQNLPSVLRWIIRQQRAVSMALGPKLTFLYFYYIALSYNTPHRTKVHFPTMHCAIIQHLHFMTFSLTDPV